MPFLNANNVIPDSAPDEPQGLSRNEVSKMFDRIARRYDILNRLLSFGTDVMWRKKMASFLPTHHSQRVLDLATGTADQILALFEKSDRIKSAIGMDLAEKMLEIGRVKIRRLGLSGVTTLVMQWISPRVTVSSMLSRFPLAYGTSRMSTGHSGKYIEC
jgi:hypothetical protein